MEVILLEDVKSLGKRGDRVNVSDGYGRNYILPRKLGIEATPKNLNDWKLARANEEKVKREQLASAQALAADLAGKSISLTIKSGKDGKAFGSISTREIAQAVAEQLGFEIDKKKLVLETPIKSAGTFL